MEVRDYECDIQGIVNNANYLHYTEHTRHLYLQSLGISFARLHEKGIDPVVARMNLQYKTPLRSDDVFVSKLGIRKEGLRYIFNQDIFRKADNQVGQQRRLRPSLRISIKSMCQNGSCRNSRRFNSHFDTTLLPVYFFVNQSVNSFRSFAKRK